MILSQLQHNWLVNYDNFRFSHQVEQIITQLTDFWQDPLPPRILLADTEPHRFLAVFFACVALDYPVFLANPHWKTKEWQEIYQLVKPNLIWHQQEQVFFKASSSITNCPGTIMIPTGGSSGKIRFAMHNWRTLSAAVNGFVEYFESGRVNSCCLLPLYHVGGLMQCLRSFLTGGKLLLLAYAALKNNQFKWEFDTQNYFLSLVPTQLQHLLELNPECLSGFSTILVGGAPTWTTLLDRARKHQIPLALTYGMTETAAQIVTLKPYEFLKGNNSSGRVLEHAHITITDQEGNILPQGKTGTISIKADSLCLGYYPHLFSPDFCFLSQDLGRFDVQDYLTILGRSNRSIITGGETVFPEEVESVILDTGLVRDVCVLGLADNYWGEVITAVYVSATPNQGHQEISIAIQEKLSKYKCPKYWLECDRLPRNLQGKINHQELKQWAITQL
ncbi:2-succinylbenzoate--CoA ligase [Gloeocapsa sp. PCC 73106]|uniref:2-succinylbenzoate--CoA ligase n=1 Tax=Gloeocapsa sp. PCC 73106 TaxID=102232 RepID=UPI0002AC9E85|nr:2-succinylbenzoate--CoA ligase [Gloeocapsa sp. PCC 73106]ELR98201.1 acyl-CoA synthetase (AMP-forming)/AMP-acid ligase II [Gloeocapsa sp. PCC 73106]